MPAVRMTLVRIPSCDHSGVVLSNWISLMFAVMSTSDQAPYVIASYVITLGGIGLYVWRLFARARKIAPQVREEDRPWT